MFDYHLPICSLGKFLEKISEVFSSKEESQIDLNTQVSNRKLNVLFLGKVRMKI